MEFNRKNMLKIFFLAACIILFYLAFKHIDIVFGFLNWLLGVLTPFIIAGCLTFFLNVPLKAIERHLFRPKDGKPVGKFKEKARRPIAIVLSVLLFLFVITVFLVIIIPEVGKSLVRIAENIPHTLENIQNWFTDMSKREDFLGQFISSLTIDWTTVSNNTVSFLTTNSGTLVSSAFSVISSVISMAVNFLLGFVISIYILMRKEKISSDVKKLIYAILPMKAADFLVEVGHITNKSFYNSITGQMIECLIIGSLTALGMTIFGFPYAALGGVVVAVLSWIPMFGIYIGTAIVSLLLLTENPIQALWFFIFMVCLQQLEGNLIYPRVVGSKVGLPPVVFISAIILFGNIFGVIGILVSAPVTFVLYTLIRRFVYRRIDRLDVPPEKYAIQYDNSPDSAEIEKIQKQVDQEARKAMRKTDAEALQETGSVKQKLSKKFFSRRNK